MQNGYVERFNGTYRRDVLNAYLFDSLDSVRLITKGWRQEYNEFRPHSSLDDKTPNEVHNKCLNKPDFSIYECVG